MARVTFVVSPGARTTGLVGRHGDAWKVRVAAPPEKGRANEALCVWLAGILGVPRNDVAVAGGSRSRRKILEVSGVDETTVDERLARSAGA